MKKIVEWCKRSDSFFLKGLPGSCLLAFLIAGAETFKKDVTFERMMLALLLLGIGYLLWVVFFVMPWQLSETEKDGTPQFTNGLMLVGEAVVLVVLTMWVGGYI